MAYEILWRFEVPQGWRAAFEEAYGPQGAWARLFARADGFLEVRLLRSADCYITIDRWASQQAFENFRADFAAAYEALDLTLQGLTANETRIGAFDGV